MSSNGSHCGGSIYKPVPRTKLSDGQQQMLTEFFERNQYPDLSAKRVIAKNTGLDIGQIRVWFQNKRARMRFILERKATMKVDYSNSDRLRRSNKRDLIEIGNEENKEKNHGSALETQSCGTVLETLKYCSKVLSGNGKVTDIRNQ